MKRFDPEKELNKIRYGKRNKVIIGVISLLVISLVGVSFALYEISNKKELIYSTVGDFTKRDIMLSVLVDGVKQDNFPSLSEAKVFAGLDCVNGSSGTFDYQNNALILKTNGPDKCTVKFETRTQDASGANPPELYQGMIPIIFASNGEVRVANLKSWYDYDRRNWANAIIVDDSKRSKYVNDNGSFKSATVIDIANDVVQWYVWIPRFRYKLFYQPSALTYTPPTFGGGSTGPEKAIEIEFEKGKNRVYGNNQGEWLTHPAFSFGGTELNGFWMGKFEVGGTINDPVVKPNVKSLVGRPIKAVFDKVHAMTADGNKYGMTSDADVHLIRNSDWGAVAYLTQSKYGRCPSGSCTEVWINNAVSGSSKKTATGAITGCSGTAVSAAVKYNMTACETNYTWDKNGKNASTTGAIVGVYDMSGGMWEYVMGNMLDANGAFNPGASRFTTLDPKYYDAYLYDASSTEATDRWHWGDATEEMMYSTSSGTKNWYGDDADFVHNTATWMYRGGHAEDGTKAGIFAYNRHGGGATNYSSFRTVITAP